MGCFKHALLARGGGTSEEASGGGRYMFLLHGFRVISVSILIFSFSLGERTPYFLVVSPYPSNK